MFVPFYLVHCTGNNRNIAALEVQTWSGGKTLEKQENEKEIIEERRVDSGLISPGGEGSGDLGMRTTQVYKHLTLLSTSPSSPTSLTPPPYPIPSIHPWVK